MLDKPTHFAHIKRGIVTQVILADQEFIDSGAVGDPKEWIATYIESNNPAGIGMKYNKKTGAFTQIKPCVFCFYVRRFFLKLIGRECAGCPKN